MGHTDANSLCRGIFGAAILIMATLPAWGQLSGEVETPTVPMPEGTEPTDISDWILVEVAVLVDDGEETLLSEQWPARPNVRYPQNYRRLLDINLIQQLQERFPAADIAETADGHIRVMLEDPARVLSKAIIDEQLRLAREVEELALLTEQSESDQEMPAPQDDTLYGEVGAADMETGPLIPLDRLTAGSETEPQEPPIDRLLNPSVTLPFYDEAPQSTREQSPIVMQMLGENSTADSNGDPVAPPPTLPTPFISRPMTLLAEGLRALQRRPGNALEASAAWIQGPDANTRPIVLDRSGDTTPRAPLQGFIQLRTRDSLKIGVNFWRATDGGYMPDTFRMTPPEKADPGISYGESMSGDTISEEVALEFQRKLSELEVFIASGQPLSEFSYASTEEINPNPEANDPEPNALQDWSWRHLIHIADTRSLEAGVVRYFDHPVIKVLVTYKELTWGEVYSQGHEEWLASQIQQAEAEAETEAESRQ